MTEDATATALNLSPQHRPLATLTNKLRRRSKAPDVDGVLHKLWPSNIPEQGSSEPRSELTIFRRFLPYTPAYIVQSTSVATLEMNAGLKDVVKAMMEDAVTIRKAMVQTGALSSKVASGDAQSLNQSCRWISTKDDHADKIISTTAQYFLAQRVVVRAPFPVSRPAACPLRELHDCCIAEIVPHR